MLTNWMQHVPPAGGMDLHGQLQRLEVPADLL